MSALSNRAGCQEEIHRLVAEDPWMAKFALWSSLARLDLHDLNEVLEAVEAAAEGLHFTPEGLLAKLEAERWGYPH